MVIEPAPGRSVDDVQRALFEQPGVSSVQEIAVLGQLLEERLSQFTGILRTLEGFGLVLALRMMLEPKLAKYRYPLFELPPAPEPPAVAPSAVAGAKRPDQFASG